MTAIRSAPQRNVDERTVKVDENPVPWSAAGSPASMHMHPAATADYIKSLDPDAGSVGAPTARAVVSQARAMLFVGPAVLARWRVKVR